MANNKVLIVEDEQTLIDMYSLKLEKEGLLVCKAMDGEEAIEVAKAEKPDVIFLDVMLPKVDGFSVLEQLREIKDFSKTPVVMLTNLGQEEDSEKGKKLGATAYLIKANVTPAELATKAKEILKIA